MPRPHAFLAAAVLVGLIFPRASARPQGDPICIAEQAHLLPGGGTTSSFGLAVFVSGDTALVGAPGGDPEAAFVFERSAGTWSEQQQLVSAVPESFGTSVARSGDTIVVGAISASAAALYCGAAYVYVFDGATWIQQARLVANDGATHDQFGTSVAIEGDTILVGAPFVNGLGNDRGAAYVFVRSGSTWSQRAKLVASQSVNFNNFGMSVALSGDTALVGAPAARTIPPTCSSAAARAGASR